MAGSLKSCVPIINAGDGGHNHPTQTLTDLMTIRREKGRLEHMTIGLCGDLKFGRTVHSLIGAMSRYEGIRFVLISPPELRVPAYITNSLAERGIPFTEVETFAECGLCVTAAVISPVGSINDHGREIVFPSGKEEMGPVLTKLYKTLRGIQMGEIEAPEGWVVTVK